jgi:hypothetical protein
LRGVGSLYGLISRVWPFVGPILGLGTAAYALDLGIDELKRLALFISPYVLNTRRLWLILAILFLYFAYVEFRHRHNPLAVLSLDLELRLDKPDGSRATLMRTQRIRAYHDNVTGFHRMVTADSPGKIPRDQIRFDISHETDEKKKERPYFQGDETRWEFIHRFSPIPRNPLVLGLNTVERTETIVFVDSYMRPEEHLTLIIPEYYPHKRVSITILFHPERVCRLEDCEALRIHANGVTKIPLRDVPPNGVRLTVRNPIAGERFKITWKYPPIATAAG